MNIRAQAVEQARANGLCTQCLKHKAAPHRFQCGHCIDMNKTKRRRRVKKLKSKGLCKRCGKEPQVEGRALCAACGEKARVAWRKRYALKKARKAALGAKDTGTGKRHYKRRVPVASIQMAGAVADLERFIGNLKMMSAAEYLEVREELIRSIIRRGGDSGNS